jgi:hypothetical protein
MADLLSTYFGPLDKSACIYFLIISIIFFIVLVLVSISEIIFLVQNFKTVNFRMVINGVLILFNIFLAYFVNRLLNTMCTRSLS